MTTDQATEAARSTPEQRSVEHYFRPDDLRAIGGTRAKLQASCGRVVEVNEPAHSSNWRPDYIQTVGQLVPLPEAEDCTDCVRVISLALRLLSDGHGR